MKPVVTPDEMAAIDAAAVEPVDVLIERAGRATAQVALDMLGRMGGVYGSRVAVLAGKGNNGADGRSAAAFLERQGVQCRVFDIGSGVHQPGAVDGSGFDLVIDACYGTGLRGEFRSEELPIVVGQTAVLAVDISSGVDGLTGRRKGTPLSATATVTFAAMKPGLLFEPGRTLVGETTVADIGLDCSRARAWHVERHDLDRWPRREPTAHKWRHAVAVVGGSPGMAGAAAMTSTAAMRAGAGHVIKAVPGQLGPGVGTPIEAVTVSMRDDPDRTTALVKRCGAVVVGPGLSLDDEGTVTVVKQLLIETEAALVFDAGALDPDLLNGVRPSSPADERLPVLTPHDGEFERLLGDPPGDDRMASARRAAAELEAVVLLKGPTTVIAHPDGRVLVSTAGDQRLATAGTGDVLSGLIGAGLALGLEPLLAAGLGAELHGTAAMTGLRHGLTAGDLPGLVAHFLSADLDDGR